MPSKKGTQETVRALRTIFEQHRNERICVLGTTCCGKTTLLKYLPDCEDLDDIWWPTLTDEEADSILHGSWTSEVGALIGRTVQERISIKPGTPLFSQLLIDCDVVVYLDISDELLEKHCAKRGMNYNTSKIIKNMLEGSLKRRKIQDSNTFYRLVLTE